MSPYLIISVVADETVIVDSELQSCEATVTFSESCIKQQIAVIDSLPEAFLYDEDIAELPSVEPIRPLELVKWARPGDIAYHHIDLIRYVST
ncbi:hypothetical protein BSL78_28454 [Apostichopus japonicus]|uniref:Uncharacterized protein n=1 Tax=Stichopus japonicus TaxID=307972 RepID=A0A2G8JG61_STIJA|nr:hypothetical protein BSL78_28454 [Apostichopus japonicus]